MTPLETIAVIFTLANVWLTVKENLWCWPAGIVGVALYTVVNYQAHLYSNAGLQVVFLVLNVHGWYEWMHGGDHRAPLRVTRTAKRVWLWCLLLGVGGTLILLLLLRAPGDAALPFWDASTTAFSLVAQWMMNKKLLENWILWLAVDVIYVPLYAARSYYLTAGLYAVFCVLVWRGWVEWKRSIALPQVENPIPLGPDRSGGRASGAEVSAIENEQ